MNDRKIEIGLELVDSMEVRKSAGSTKHKVVVTFGMEGVSGNEAEGLILAGLRVKYQAQLRKLPETELVVMAGKDNNIVDVKGEILTRHAGVVDPMKAIAKMDDEAVEALLKQLQERLGK